MADKKEKKRKVGRPVSPDAKREVIQIRLTEEEKKVLMKKAEKSTGGTVSSLVRETLLEDSSAGGADVWKK